MCIPALGSTPSYYIDSVAGSDSNPGTLASPWLTIGKAITSAMYRQGLTIGLKAGSTFRPAATTLPWGGTPGYPVTFTQYGSGAMPQILGSLRVSSLVWTQFSGNVYVSTAAGIGNPAMMWQNINTYLVKDTSSALTIPGSFFADNANSKLYVLTMDGSDPTGSVFDKANISQIFTCTKSWVTFEGVQIAHGSNTNGSNIFFFNASPSITGLTVQQCVLGPSAGGGVFCGGTATIQNNYIYANWNGVLYPSGTGTGIEISTTAANGTIVRNNTGTLSYHHVRAINSVTGVQIYGNRFWLAQVNGIDHQGAGASVYQNFIHHRPSGTSGHGIDSQSGGTNMISENNAVYCDYNLTTSINVQCAAIATGSGYTLNNNCYWNVYQQPFVGIGKVNTTGYLTLVDYRAALLANGYGTQEANSIEADPMVSNMDMNTVNSFYPLPSSPMIRAGLAIPGINDNRFHSPPDIGAYQTPY